MLKFYFMYIAFPARVYKACKINPSILKDGFRLFRATESLWQGFSQKVCLASGNIPRHWLWRCRIEDEISPLVNDTFASVPWLSILLIPRELGKPQIAPKDVRPTKVMHVFDRQCFGPRHGQGRKDWRHPVSV